MPMNGGLALFLAALAIACMIVLTDFSFGGLIVIGPSAAASLARRNLLSVTILTAFVALSLENVHEQGGNWP